MTADPGTIPLSLSYYTVPELSAPQMVRAAAAAGFAFCGARLLNGQPGRDLAPLMENASLRRETIACLHDAGMRVLDASGARLRPETDMTAFAAFVDVAAELPLQTIAQILGVPEADSHQLFSWTSTILDYRDRAILKFFL